MERATTLVDALTLRALRHERVLEVLDLRAARSARKLAQRIEAGAQRWAAERDGFARSTAAAELLEMMEAADMVLLAGDSPVPSTERPVAPTSAVVPTEGEASASGEGAEDELRQSTKDATAWLSALGVPPRGRR